MLGCLLQVFISTERTLYLPEQAIIQRAYGKTHFNNNSHLKQDIIVNILFYFWHIKWKLLGGMLKMRDEKTMEYIQLTGE